MTSKLVFNEEQHEYTVGERVLPSITQLMDEYGITNSEWYGFQARFRGSHVHKATEFYDEGDLDYDGLDELIKPYVDAYIKFRKETKMEILYSELPMYDSGNWIAGTLDRIVYFQGKIVMFDIKTGTMPKWVHIQLAGYRHLFKCWKNIGPLSFAHQPIPSEYYALQLRADGTYRFNRVLINKILEGKKILDSMIAINNFKRITTHGRD